MPDNFNRFKYQDPSPFSVFKTELSEYHIIRRDNKKMVMAYQIFSPDNWTYLLEALKNGTHKEYELKKK